MKKTFILMLILVALMSLDLIPQITVKAQIATTTSAPAMEWQQEYRDYWVLVGENALSNIVETVDGGFAFLSLGYSFQGILHPARLFKVDAEGNLELTKVLDSFVASIIIQTSDGGYEIFGNWRLPQAYEFERTLIKTDSEGNIQWSDNSSKVPDFGLSPKMVKTSDGGYAYVMGTEIVKTAFNNQTRWEKYTAINRTRTSFEIEQNYTVTDIPIYLCSLIETSDGSLVSVGVAYTSATNSFMGAACILKTEAFLPPPSQTLLPTPISTASPTPYLPQIRNAPHLDPSFYLIPVTVVFAVILVSVLFYRRYRKISNSVKKLG